MSKVKKLSKNEAIKYIIEHQEILDDTFNMNMISLINDDIVVGVINEGEFKVRVHPRMGDLSTLEKNIKKLIKIKTRR